MRGRDRPEFARRDARERPELAVEVGEVGIPEALGDARPRELGTLGGQRERAARAHHRRVPLGREADRLLEPREEPAGALPERRRDLGHARALGESDGRGFEAGIDGHAMGFEQPPEELGLEDGEPGRLAFGLHEPALEARGRVAPDVGERDVPPGEFAGRRAEEGTRGAGPEERADRWSARGSVANVFSCS